MKIIWLVFLWISWGQACFQQEDLWCTPYWNRNIICPIPPQEKDLWRGHDTVSIQVTLAAPFTTKLPPAEPHHLGFFNYPPEIMLHVLSHFTFKDLALFAKCNRATYASASAMFFLWFKDLSGQRMTSLMCFFGAHLKGSMLFAYNTFFKSVYTQQTFWCLAFRHLTFRPESQLARQNFFNQGYLETQANIQNHIQSQLKTLHLKISPELTFLPADLRGSHFERITLEVTPPTKRGALIDVSILYTLNNLQHLGIPCQEFYAIPSLSMENLTELDLSHNSISELSPLASCKSLRFLWLGFNRIQSLTPLRFCPRLERLHVPHNLIHDLEPLGDCIRLVEMDCAENIIDSQSLEQFLRLQSYRGLGGKSSPPLAMLPLSKLNLRKNKIQTLPWTYFGPSLQGCEIYLEGNPLSPETLDAFNQLIKTGHLKPLVLRSHNVIYDQHPVNCCSLL